jgi:DNA-directed RNA polymerases I, II, and III subunit RPABC2
MSTHKDYIAGGSANENVAILDSNYVLNKKDKKTNPILTKYEKARILGTRAIQISKGAKPTVNIGKLHDALKIAEKEFNEGNIPLIVRRYLPDGTYEDWSLSELEKR